MLEGRANSAFSGSHVSENNSSGKQKERAKINITYRDARQALFGMQVPAEYAVAQGQNLGNITEGCIQTGGGTEWDLPVRNGRDPGLEVRTMLGAYAGHEQAALLRGLALLGYGAQDRSVIKPFLRAYALAGMNLFQNFHGHNDPEFTDFVDDTINEIREETGLNFYSSGVLVVEDNVNYDENKLVEFARHRASKGCKELYIKSASGRVNPDAIRSLVDRLMKEVPDIPVTLHAHDTNFEAIPAYIAAAEAAVRHGRTISLDALPFALAGNTAQPDLMLVRQAFLDHPDERVRNIAPAANEQALAADKNPLLEMRARYSHVEGCFDPEILDLTYATRSPGGADGSLRGIAQLEENLGILLGTRDWNVIKREIFKAQAAIDKTLGEPNQITPFAYFTTTQAAFSLIELVRIIENNLKQENQETGSKMLWRELNPAKRLELIHQKLETVDAADLFTKTSMRSETVDFVLGKVGRPPESMDQRIIDIAKIAKGTEVEPVSYQEARQWLFDEGLLGEEALAEDCVQHGKDEWKILQVATLWSPTDRKRGLKHVKGLADESVRPKPLPDFPGYMKDDYIDLAGGPALIEEIALHSMNIARGRYFLSRIERLQIEESDEPIADKAFYKAFYERHIEQSLANIAECFRQALQKVKAKKDTDQAVAWAATCLNTAVFKHCKAKGLDDSLEARIPQITSQFLEQLGIDTASRKPVNRASQNADAPGLTV